MKYPNSPHQNSQGGQNQAEFEKLSQIRGVHKVT